MGDSKDIVVVVQDLSKEATDLNLFGRERITNAMMALTEALHNADSLTLSIEGVQTELQIIFEQAKTLSKEAFERDDLLQEFARLSKIAVMGEAEMLRQRDAVLDEMGEIYNRLTGGDFHSKDFKLGAEIYNVAIEQHNAAFWESLPYEIANAMGKPWQHWHGDLLHDLIIGEAEEIADGNNLELEDVYAFRELLFEMVNKLYEKGE
jgi:hypothetical protein